ncbi:MAG: hypothetical protein M3H12_16775, partial [Chromatiales bacterium]
MNQPLFQQLALLVVDALFVIRDIGLLSVEFLAVLPNLYESIPARYQCIRDAIIKSMNEESLTPKHNKSHAPAKYFLQAKASLKALLSTEDLKYLIDSKGERRDWAAGASLKNGAADRFLSGLAITDWDIDNLLKSLIDNLGVETRFDSEIECSIKGPDPNGTYFSFLGCPFILTSSLA